MLAFDSLTLRRGARTLLDNVSVTVHANQRVGVVGRNGVGKSSLFSAIRGELTLDGGTVRYPKSLALASVAQETPALQISALEHALDGDTELRHWEGVLKKAEDADDIDKLVDAHENLGRIDGYAAPARAAQLLHGLGFTTADQSRHVASFSGGWRMRLNLARALLKRSDILLLDEPTNHLDLDAVLWLQDWLANYPGTLMLISHDAEFLDHVTTHTMHMEPGKATLYTGNHTAFERMRAERLSQQAAAHTLQARKTAEITRFVDRFRAQATKARQVQSRIKALERMEMIAPVLAESEFSFRFPEPAKLPSPLLSVHEGEAGYDGVALIHQIKMVLNPGERIALVGPNGAGKSTLVQAIAGKRPWVSGRETRSPQLKIGYFTQHQVDTLDMTASPILHLRRIAPELPEQKARDYLGGWGFNGDRAFEAVAPFSGGEKARLALALVAWPAPNLLLLDEPTNHLDLDLRRALEMALNDYAGAVVLVSHDRHLVESTTDTLWRVAGGKAEPFEGDLADYAKWLGEHRKAMLKEGASAAAKVAKAPAAAPATQAKPVPPAPATTTARPPVPAAVAVAPVKKTPITPALSAADRRAREKPLKDDIRRFEKRIETLNAELARHSAILADPALYTDPARRAERERVQADHSRAQAALEATETAWLEASEALALLDA